MASRRNKHAFTGVCTKSKKKTIAQNNAPRLIVNLLRIRSIDVGIKFLSNRELHVE